MTNKIEVVTMLDKERLINITRKQKDKKSEPLYWITIERKRFGMKYTLPSLTKKDIGLINELIKDLDEWIDDI